MIDSVIMKIWRGSKTKFNQSVLHQLATNQTDLQLFVFKVDLGWIGELLGLHRHLLSV